MMDMHNTNSASYMRKGKEFRTENKWGQVLQSNILESSYLGSLSRLSEKAGQWIGIDLPRKIADAIAR